MTKIIYLDSAASSLKPDSVINAEMNFLRNDYANSGRGVCARAVAVDKMLDSSRRRVAEFINASDSKNIVFTFGATDALNRIANILHSSGTMQNKPVVIVSDLDHHSARLPWEELKRKGKCEIDVCGLGRNFELNFPAFTKADIFVITAMSNVLGRAQDVKQLIKQARDLNPDIITIVDAAQYIAHTSIDVVDWGCDFLCFSAHKIGADTGVGVMYVKEPERWSVDKFGGGMLRQIKGVGEWTLESAPEKFEAGTLPLTQIAGLPAAIDYLKEHGDNHEMIEYLHGELSKINGLKILTRSSDYLLTFVPKTMHCLDFGAIMGAHGVCLRVGNMCASWIHRILEVDASVRISCGPWNTMDEMDKVVDIIKNTVK